MAKYVYPCILSPEKDGGYSVSFPDLPGCYSQGSDLSDALEMAKDALCLMLYDMEESKKEIPSPSATKDIETDSESFVSLVMCDTMEHRKFFDNYLEAALTACQSFNEELEGTTFDKL